MFNRDDKKWKSASAKSLKELLAVEPIDRLLDTKKRQELLSHIKESIGLEAAVFQKLGTPLIHNLIKYCQNLPETSTYYANRGGLVDRALNRTEAALQLARNILMQGKDTPPSPEQKLWLYALFSAALLQGIGKLHTDYRVDLYDTNGHLVKQWQPLLEDISSVGKYYNYDFLRGDDPTFRNNVTPLLARQIMPTSGFTWITSNPEVFATWLALLQEDNESAGPFAAILERANALTIQRYLNEFLLTHAEKGVTNRIGTFVDNVPENTVEKEQAMGAEFITWVTQGLETGKIIINKLPMLMEVLPTGVVMSPELFDMFAQEHRKFKNKYAIQRAFLAWNLHQMTEAAAKSFAKMDQSEKSIVSGIQLDTAILPKQVKIYNSTTNKIVNISSLHLIHKIKAYGELNLNTPMTMEHLSMDGKWRSPDEIPTLQLGNIQGA